MSEGQSVARERASVAKPHDFGYISLISLSETTNCFKLWSLKNYEQ